MSFESMQIPTAIREAFPEKETQKLIYDLAIKESQTQSDRQLWDSFLSQHAFGINPFTNKPYSLEHKKTWIYEVIRAVRVLAGKSETTHDKVKRWLDEEFKPNQIKEGALERYPTEDFAAAVETLKEVQHKITPDRKAFNECFLKKWSAIFAPSNISNITADQLAAFTSFSENQHWTGIHRHNSNITIDLNAFHRTLSVLLDESREVKVRIDEIDPPRGQGQKLVRGFGKAVYTAIRVLSATIRDLS
ncbi:MAG TPA: hypothetical protein VE954_38185 [Oligoflexus sp.]|uniref:hypothetical protein n=1 Tax=Oligoflexus sp. TaxID=1971216 RepID=UPI002D610494|nr:hypothetical protein [Oligoflexus sp.]HYX38969.1 hypothetical protein [Oligoflexus sp.]